MFVLPYLEFRPRIAADIDAAADAAIIGRAEVGARCHLGRLATLRADGESIRIGADCWFNDFSTVHIAHGFLPATVGHGVTVGAFGLVHACDLGDGCVVGEHALVMDNSRVGPGAVIAADSVVPPGKTLEGGWLYAGIPAKAVRAVSAEELAALHEALRKDRRGDEPAGDAVLRGAHPPAAPRLAAGFGVPHKLAGSAFVAPSAIIEGNLSLGAGGSVWFGVEMVGGGDIVIGAGSNFQDNSRIVLKAGERVEIGERVTVGHNVRMATCVVEDGAMIGMGSVVGAGTIVRAGGVIAAGAETAPGTEVAAGEIWSGTPARRWKPVPDDTRVNFARGAETYIEYARNYSR
ncbi:MAG: gamma carbonic anhydrase family protein [Proteobacteria bacterium]|nr:gamma carbonic anhydrase family protein [Pseudomonadota bacterium]